MWGRVLVVCAALAAVSGDSHALVPVKTIALPGVGAGASVVVGQNIYVAIESTIFKLTVGNLEIKDKLVLPDVASVQNLVPNGEQLLAVCQSTTTLTSVLEINLNKFSVDRRLEVESPTERIYGIKAAAISTKGRGTGSLTIGARIFERAKFDQITKTTSFVLLGSATKNPVTIISAWEFYISRPGQITLQVVRLQNKVYTVVGQTNYTATSLGFNRIELNETSQIVAQQGDLISFILYEKGATVPYDEINTNNTQVGLSVSSSAAGAEISSQQGREYSLKAYGSSLFTVGYSVHRRYSTVLEERALHSKLPSASATLSVSGTPTLSAVATRAQSAATQTASPSSSQSASVSVTPSKQIVSSTIDLSMSLSCAGSTGLVTAWEAYVSKAGIVTFQVWRPPASEGLPYTLVGSNEVQFTAAGRRIVFVDSKSQIRFQRGDLVGWKSDAPISFDEFSSPLEAKLTGAVHIDTFRGVITFPSQSQTVRLRMYSVRAHTKSIDDSVLVLGSYTSPAFVVVASIPSFKILRAQSLTGPQNTFLTDVVIDETRSRAIFTAESSPGRLIAVSLDSLEISEVLNLDTTFAATSIASDGKGRYLVKTSTQLVQVDASVLEAQNQIDVDENVASMEYSSATGILYMGTFKGQVVRAINDFSPVVGLSKLSSQTLKFGNSSVLNVRGIHIIPKTNSIPEEIVTVSLGIVQNSTIITQLSTAGKPELVTVSPSCAHISGGVTLTISGSGLDESTRAVLRFPSSTSAFFTPSESDIQTNFAQGAVRIVDAKGKLAAQGRVEIFDEEWGSICDDGTFDDKEARVLCRAAGLSGGVFSGRCTGAGCGTGDVAIAGIRCAGWESFPKQCQISSWGNVPGTCTHASDVTISCTVPEIMSSRLHGPLSGSVAEGEKIVEAPIDPTTGEFSVVSPGTTSALAATVTLISFGSIESQAFKFSFYDAKLTTVLPVSVPTRATTDLVVTGSGFVSDPAAAARLISLASRETLRGVNVQVIQPITATQVTLRITTSGNLQAGKVGLEIALDGQHWIGGLTITLTHLLTDSIVPSVGPATGGTSVTVKCSGIVKSSTVKVGVFPSLRATTPIAVVRSGIVISEDANSVTFVTPASVDTAPDRAAGPTGKPSVVDPSKSRESELYFGISLNGQNYEMVDKPFSFYQATFSSLHPAVGHKDGGSFVSILGWGFPVSPYSKLKFVFISSENITVPARSVDSKTLVAKVPASPGNGKFRVEVSFNGQQFHSTSLVFEFFSATVTGLSPPYFMGSESIPLEVIGTGFPTSAPTECKVSFGTEDNGGVVTVDGTVQSASSILIKESPFLGPSNGILPVSVSFDGGEQFFSSAAKASVYTARVTNLVPAVLSAGSEVVVSLYGDGFFATKSPQVELAPLELVEGEKNVIVSATYIDPVEMRITLPKTLRSGKYSVILKLDNGQPGIEALRQLKVLPSLDAAPANN